MGLARTRHKGEPKGLRPSVTEAKVRRAEGARKASEGSRVLRLTWIPLAVALSQERRSVLSFRDSGQMQEGGRKKGASWGKGTRPL